MRFTIGNFQFERDDEQVMAATWGDRTLHLLTNSRVYDCNRNTAQLALAGDHDLHGVDALAWTGSHLYAATTGMGGDRALYRVNRYTGRSSYALPLTFELRNMSGLAWTGSIFIAAIRGTDMASRAYTAIPDRFNRNSNLFVLPGDFQRLWTWDDADPTAGDASDNQRGLQQEGPDMIRDLTGRLTGPDVPAPVRIAYVRIPPLADTTAQFQELLRVRLARRLAPRFAKDPFLARELRDEEKGLIREAQETVLAQREPNPETPTNSIGRYDGGFYGSDASVDDRTGTATVRGRRFS